MSTSSISSMLNSRLRVSGYASGLDVDSMVQKLMQVETARVDKVKQDKQRLEWQRDDYRNITSLLRGLKDKYFNVTSSTNLLSSSAFNKTAVAVSDPSVVQVTGSSTAGVSTHTITVNNIATVGAQAGATTGTDSLGGTINFDISTGSMLMSDFTKKTTADSVLQINGKDYYFKADETVSQFMTRINNDSTNTTYRLSYDSTGTKFVLTTKSTGVNTIGATGTFMQSAGLAADDVTSIVETGVDASFIIDGINYTSKTNSYTADGLTYNFLKGGGVTSNVSSTRDVEGMLKNIKEFVDTYNNIISTINTETTEKKYRDYTPLTDDQRSAMSENDIKLWEEKAKSGSLYGDSLLNGLGDRLKTAMYNAINLADGSQTTLSSIGISTLSRYDKGKLTIDEDKLRKALTENPEKVEEMFTKESTTLYSPDTTNSTRQQENGVLYKLDDIFNDYIRTNRDSRGKKGLLLEKAGYTDDTTDVQNYMQDLISEKEDLISELSDKLLEKEDAYYTKFTAMETAINNMNSQSSWLSQQLGS